MLYCILLNVCFEYATFSSIAAHLFELRSPCDHELLNCVSVLSGRFFITALPSIYQ